MWKVEATLHVSMYQQNQRGCMRAYFYVCGDASRMAKDVDDALHEIVKKHGGFNEGKAIDYVKELTYN